MTVLDGNNDNKSELERLQREVRELRERINERSLRPLGDWSPIGSSSSLAPPHFA
jgi:hypothetical protein